MSDYTDNNQMLIDKCKNLIGEVDKPVYFQQTIKVKKTPHIVLCTIYGCVLSSRDELKLMDYEEKWYEVKPNQANVGYILQTLYQRLIGDKMNAPVAVAEYDNDVNATIISKG